MFRRVVGQRDFMSGTVEDIGHVSGILPLITPDNHFHHLNTAHVTESAIVKTCAAAPL
jgi:hypothetical protein